MDEENKTNAQYKDFSGKNYKNPCDITNLFKMENKKVSKNSTIDEIYYNKSYVITRLKQDKYGKNIIYLFSIQDDKEIYKSNLFFIEALNKIKEELKLNEIEKLNDLILECKIIISFRVGQLKTDSNKNKNHLILMTYRNL